MENNWKILEPIQIGSKLLKNKIIVAAHSYGYVDDSGLPTDDLQYYVLERAKGGVGMIVLGGTSISIEGTLVERMARNVGNEIIPKYKALSDRVHYYDTIILDQLMHVGGQLDSFEGSRIVGPSSIPHEMCNSIPIELTEKEIDQIIQDFSAAAYRAKAGSLDGVELKCDQGFLIHQFLSPFYNRRNDKYGGSYQRRLSFLVNIINQVRKECGSEFILGVRIVGDTFVPGDLTLDDGIQIAKDICDTGQVDYISVNGATNSTYPGYLLGHGDSSIEPMNFASIARKIKSEITIPVVVASMITHPLEAEHLVREGIADLVAMTRAHIADPEIVNKVASNKIDEIRPCVLCNQGCVGNHWKGSDIRCIHNPATGRERELGIGTINQIQTSKKFAVIGGGPAGLEFARIAALRGHKVDLFEKNRELGGQILLAKSLPYRQGMIDIVHFLTTQLQKNMVSIHLGIELTKDDLITSAADFDLVILATGSNLYIPPIFPDVDPSAMLSIQDVLEEKKPLDNNILIISVDWRQNALGMAEWLIQRKKNVSISTPAFFVGDGLDVVSLTSYYSRLQKSVKFFPLTALISYKNKIARLRNVLSNEIQELHPVDQIIFVTGAKPNNILFESLKNEIPNILPIGDCVTPLGIPEAMLDANRKARIV